MCAHRFSESVCLDLRRPMAPPDDALVAPIRGKAGTAEELARGGVRQRLGAEAEVAFDAMRLVYAPYWRVEASLRGFHLGIEVGKKQDGSLSYVLPTGGRRSSDHTFMVCARDLGSTAGVGQAPSHPLGALAATLALPPPPLGELSLLSLRPPRRDENPEVVHANVTAEQARSRVLGHLRESAAPRDAIYSTYEPSIRGERFCLYPFWVLRYCLSGPSAADPLIERFVLVSAYSGETIARNDPPRHRSPGWTTRLLDRLLGG